MQKSASPRWLIATLALALLILLAGGAWFYTSQEQQLRQKAEDDLLAIAELKASQIAAWRGERLANAAILTESPFFTAGVSDWLANPQGAIQADILRRFRSMQVNYAYYDVLLADTTGRVLLSLNNGPGLLYEDTMRALAAAFERRQPVMSNLHIGPGDLPPHLDLLSPLFAGSGPDAEPFGAVILRVDASQFLYPLLQTWPTQSASAETLIVRQDGDSVLFLNELRLRAGSAMTLRIPLTQTNVPAVMAVLGQRGIVQGVDYRGIEVLAVISAIPDSPWFMITKIDRAEILADWRFRSMLILGLIVGMVIVVATAGGVVWQRMQKVQYQAFFQAEKARHESEERYRQLFENMLEGCQIIGFDWRYLYLNDAAARHGRQPKEALLGHTMMECYPGIDTTPMFAVLQRGMEERTAHTIENEFVYADGTSGWFDLRIQPVPEGIFVLSLDVSERVHAAQKTAELAAIVQSSEDAILGKTLDGIITSWNAGAERMYGYTASEAIGQPVAMLIPPEYRDEPAAILEKINHGEHVTNQESVRQRKDGRRLNVSLSVSPIRDADGRIVAASAIARDITEHKQAEAFAEDR